MSKLQEARENYYYVRHISCTEFGNRKYDVVDYIEELEKSNAEMLQQMLDYVIPRKMFGCTEQWILWKRANPGFVTIIEKQTGQKIEELI